MEDEILAAIKRSAPAFVEIAKGERPDADEHSLTVAATMALLFCTINQLNLVGRFEATKKSSTTSWNVSLKHSVPAQCI